MKHNLQTIRLLSIIFLLAFSLFSEILAQNIYDVSVDPKHATTVFIEFDGKLEVETWDEDYILLQVKIENGSDEKKLLNLQQFIMQDFIKQEFTFNDFLILTIDNLEKKINQHNCHIYQLLSFKVVAPKSLDLELRCKNDLVIYNDLFENTTNDFEGLKVHVER